MALGDGIRRNIAHVDPDERAMLRDAILEMHRRFYPGNRDDTPPGGVSWWFKQDEIHQRRMCMAGRSSCPGTLMASTPSFKTVVQNLTHLVEPWSTGIGQYHPTLGAEARKSG